MVIERIPLVNVRQKHLIKVYASVSNTPFDAYSIDAADLLSQISTAQPIGGIQSLEITSERELHTWRELNYETLGRVMEVYPSLGTFSVKVSKIAFFKEHLLTVFGVNTDYYSYDSTIRPVTATFNIYNQIKPIHILVELYGHTSLPNNPGNLVEDIRKVLIYDCWFDKSEIRFDVTEDNLAIIQDATLTAAGITATGSSSK